MKEQKTRSRPNQPSNEDYWDVNDFEWLDEIEFIALIKNPLIWVILVLAGILIWALSL